MKVQKSTEARIEKQGLRDGYNQESQKAIEGGEFIHLSLEDKNKYKVQCTT